MKLIHFADLHLGVESYGRIDSSSGLSSRVIEFLSLFDQLVNRALEEDVDVVIFCGDAYKNRNPSQTLQREFAKRINSLAKGGIPVILLVGNHDLPNAEGKANTLEIYDTLAVGNVYVASHPDVYLIKTKSGVVQVATLPWPRKSVLLSREENTALSFEALNRKIEDNLARTINSLAQRVQKDYPAVLAAHLWVSGAQIGSEKGMVLGQDHTLLLSNVALPAFDYVALGHIHRHQMLYQDPPVVYSGSLGKLDFGDEGDTKGFYLVEISKENGRRQTRASFQPLKGREFISVKVEIKDWDEDPTATIIQTIRAKEVAGNIVRLHLVIPEHLLHFLREDEILGLLKEAHYFTLSREIIRKKRPAHLPLVESLTPLEVLKTYLDNKEAEPKRSKIILDYAQNLILEEMARDEGTSL